MGHGTANSVLNSRFGELTAGELREFYCSMTRGVAHKQGFSNIVPQYGAMVLPWYRWYFYGTAMVVQCYGCATDGTMRTLQRWTRGSDRAFQTLPVSDPI